MAGSNVHTAVVYHSPCNDGYATYRVFNKVMPGVTGVPVRAGAPCEEITIPVGTSIVWVVDTNLSEDMVQAWRAQGVKFINWLDHHKGNVPKDGAWPSSVATEVRRCEPDGPSAVIMACKELHLEPGPFRCLISEYDTHQFEHYTKEQCQAVYLYLRGAADSLWALCEAMCHEELYELIGRCIGEFHVFKRQATAIPVVMVRWLGELAVVARVDDWMLVNPFVDRARVVAPDAAYVLTYSDKAGGVRRWSVRSGSQPTGNCHTKCAELGGGGHAEAAGFQTSHEQAAGLTDL